MSEDNQTIMEKLAIERTQAAADRTALASERTFLAWTRTSISLVSFGFTLYKFLEYTKEEAKTGTMTAASGARNLGATLIAAGVVFLVLATIEHWKFLRSISPRERLRSWKLSFLMAATVVVLGILALINVVFQVGPF